MQRVLRIIIGLSFFLMMFGSSALGNSLQDELNSLEEELETLTIIVNNPNLIIIPKEAQEELDFDKLVVPLDELKNNVIKNILLNYSATGQRSHDIHYFLSFSNQAKKVLKNEKIPEIKRRIKKIKQEISRENSNNNSYSSSPHDCGGIITKKYRERLFDQYVKPKLGKWTQSRWKLYTVNARSSEYKLFRKQPKYEVHIPVWKARVNCIDDCVSQKFIQVKEWVNCRNSCHKRYRYKKCKEY